MNRSRIVLIVISLLMMITGMGCVALSHLITPAEVDKAALRYAVDAGVADYNDYDAWYPNMAEAARLDEDVDAAHSTVQLTLRQKIEKDELDYSIHKKVTSANLIVARQREEALFGEKGLLSMGLTMLGVGGFTGLLGLMRKRPGDLTREEVETALTTATGKTKEELSAKEKQFVQLVKGVAEFMKSQESNGNKDAVIALKSIMDKYQDSQTKVAVAAAKVNE